MRKFVYGFILSSAQNYGAYLPINTHEEIHKETITVKPVYNDHL